MSPLARHSAGRATMAVAAPVRGLRGQRAATLLHFLCFLWAVFAVTQNAGFPRSVRKEPDVTYGGSWKHLTFLNQVLQTILYLLCVISDTVALCMPSLEKRISLVVVPLRDFIFSAFVFPIGLICTKPENCTLNILHQFVPIAFWSLYAYDRELVYPLQLDDVNPTWLNHTMHTTILPLLFIELFICDHKYPCRWRGILGLFIFAVVYLSWIIWVNHASGIWAYPVLGVLTPCGRAIFISVAFLIMVIFYFVGEQLTKHLWAKRKRKCP